MYDRAPLSLAAENGYEWIVKILLERGGVNPDRADTYRRLTALLWAENGDEGVVKMLLERDDINPDQVDTFYGRTPISWAAMKGHEGVVKKN